MVDYRIARAKYLDTIVDAIKWSEVSKRFAAAKLHGILNTEAQRHRENGFSPRLRGRNAFPSRSPDAPSEARAAAPGPSGRHIGDGKFQRKGAA